jgi:hypothetical protein
MQEIVTAPAAAGAAQARVLSLSTGYIVTKALAAAAMLGVPDLLAAGPRPLAELAERTGADPGALGRVMRLLAAEGVFAEREDGTYALTALGEVLRSDIPGSMSAWAIMNAEGVYGAFAGIGHSVATGEPAFERVYGAPLFDHLGRHPELAAVFNKAMGDFSHHATSAAAHAYDFSGIERLVDIGGGDGSLLEAVLARHAGVRGVLLELPHVAELTRARLAGVGLGDRCDVVVGDFFESVPAGADAYALSWILHDWNDEHALTILRNCRAAIAPHGRLLVIETIVPPGPEPHWGKVLDVAMLVVTGGRERTEQEYAELFAAAGFELTGVHATGTLMSLLEARPV